MRASAAFAVAFTASRFPRMPAVEYTPLDQDEQLVAQHLGVGITHEVHQSLRIQLNTDLELNFSHRGRNESLRPASSSNCVAGLCCLSECMGADCT
jgi:hypothetical protein